jgi:hypothetical protein
MKKIFFLGLIFVATKFNSQTKEPAKELPTTTEVSASLKYMSLQDVISQDSLMHLNQIDLKGDNASKFSIVSYVFSVNYQRVITDDELTGNKFSPAMKTFFENLDENCRITFRDMIVKNKDDGKQYKIDALIFTVHVDGVVKKKGQHSKKH